MIFITPRVATSSPVGWGECPECWHEHYARGTGPACSICDCDANFVTSLWPRTPHAQFIEIPRCPLCGHVLAAHNQHGCMVDSDTDSRQRCGCPRKG